VARIVAFAAVKVLADAMRAWSTRNGAPERASRPWDWDFHRDGFVGSEGAGILWFLRRFKALRESVTDPPLAILCSPILVHANA
jgi:hypothetical protein